MTVYYYDFNRGKDSNDGLSILTPRKNLTLIDDNISFAGDQHLLSNDSIWEYDINTRIIPPTSWEGTKKSPIIIGKYSPQSQSSSSQKPLIKWNRKILAEEWEYDVLNNAWVFVGSSNIGALCLLRLMGEWTASYVDGGLPLASIDGRYFVSGTSLYLYAPSTVNPTEYYGEVLLSPNSGFFTISTARNWVKIQDIFFEETGTGILGFSDTSGVETGCIAENISGKTVSGLVRFGTGAAGGALRGFIQNCSVSDWGATAFNAFSAANIGFLELDISKNRITNGLNCYSQGAIYLQARSPGFRPQIHDNYISDVNYGTPNKTFDGCAIYTETGSDNADIYSNTIENCYVAFQDNSGRSTNWYSNIIKNCWSAIRVSDQNNNNTINFKFNNNVCLVGNLKLTPKFGTGHLDNGVRVYKETGDPATLEIKNNIFLHDSFSAKAAILTPQVSWNGSLDNNLYLNFPSFARQEFSPFNVEPASGILTEDPLIFLDGRPKEGSPLIHVGLLINNNKDFNKNSFYSPPSIGAFEYIYPRTMTTTRELRT